MTVSGLRPAAVLLVLCSSALAARSQDLTLHLRTPATQSDKTLRQMSDSPEEFDEKHTKSEYQDSLSEFPCPYSAAIVPCVCFADAENNIDLDCTDVESEDQLAKVFQQEFPDKEFRGFNMTQNSAIKVLGNILNGISFITVELSPGVFELEEISDYFLLESKDSLRKLDIYSSQLTSGYFPFAILDEMTELEEIRIRGSHFSWIPEIRAPKASIIEFSQGETSMIESGTFPVHDGPLELLLYINNISSVEPGFYYFADDNSFNSTEPLTIDLMYNKFRDLKTETFPFRRGDITLDFRYNEINYVETGTFVLPPPSGSGEAGLVRIYLDNNKLPSLTPNTFVFQDGYTELHFNQNEISSIAPGTFVPPATTEHFSIWLSLSTNLLTTIDEEVFGEIFPYLTTLFLHDNPLTCGCDIAWIVTNPEYLAKIDDATCVDGTNIHDLDPSLFEDVC